MVLNTDTIEETFIECPLPKWRKISYEISTLEDESAFLSKELPRLSKSKDHFVIELTGNKNDISRIMSSDDYKQALEGVSFTVKTVFTDKEKKSTSISSSFSIQDIVSEYIDKIYNGPLDKKELKNKALDLLKESSA